MTTGNIVRRVERREQLSDGEWITAAAAAAAAACGCSTNAVLLAARRGDVLSRNTNWQGTMIDAASAKAWARKMRLIFD